MIKPANKSSATVILDRSQHLPEGNRQVSDANYYITLNNPIYPETIPMVEKNLYEEKFINAKQEIYLVGQQEPRSRRFYVLQKIHKDPQNWSKPPEIPPRRPLCLIAAERLTSQRNLLIFT